MTSDHVQNLAALVKDLEAAGIDISSADSRKSLRDDIVFAHTNRKRCEKIAGYAILVVVGGVMAVIGGWIVVGMKDWVGK